ncbi:hypothetical protein B0T10DRAFT_119459 [Thelonectria olida]|uniref:Uncharacterized protein n=1 Tax=Thelonectria olida TaxID=1576542 RepID=A0A9P8WH76_9HYPO|nr:hypothetical protein B0T10DRAFT_119459 [Thelonectria olida]
MTPPLTQPLRPPRIPSPFLQRSPRRIRKRRRRRVRSRNPQSPSLELSLLPKRPVPALPPRRPRNAAKILSRSPRRRKPPLRSLPLRLTSRHWATKRRRRHPTNLESRQYPARSLKLFLKTSGDPKINPPPEPEPELEKEDAARKSDEAGSLETSEMDKGVKEEEPVVAPEAPVESEAKPETEKQEIVDEYAGLSKKQIKKLKKAKALAALESSVELEKPKESEALAEGPRESAVEPTVEPESKPEPQTDRMVDQTTEPDVDSGSKLENEATSAVEPEIVPLVEPETEAESKSETETQPSIDTETQMSVAEPSVAESATYPNLESDTKPEHEPELLERKISDAPEPDLEAAETPNDEVLLTKPTADDTESKPKPKAQRKLSEPPLEVVEAPAITELSSAIEENPSTESELAPVGKPVEEEAPPTLEKDKKKQKEKKKGKNQDVEPPADTKDLKEAEAVPVEETPIETVVPAEPVAEHAPEAVESSRETAESLPAATEDDPISTEPVDEILQGAVDPAAEAVDPAPLPESERGSTIEAEAQGVPAELTEQTESTPIDVSTVDAIPEAAPTPEIIPKSETDPESKEDDETIAVLSGKEKKKKKTAKGKTADPEPSEEPDQSKEVDLAPTTMPTDNAQPGPAAEVVEPPQGTTLAPDVTAEAAVSEHPSETETHVESEPAAFFPKPDASGALEPTSSVVNPELESKPVEEAATEQRRELQSELTLAAEPNRDLVDPLALETVFATDLSAETPLETAQPEPEQQADNDEDAALSKKDKKKKKKKKKGKEPAVDTRDESEAQKEEDEGTVNTEPVEPAAPVDTDKAIEVDTVPEPKAVDKTGLADQEPAAVEASVPTQPIKEIESSEQHHSAVEAQEPGQPVEAAEPGKQDKPSTQTLELAPIIEQPEPIEPASTQSPQQAETPKSSVEIVPKPGHHVQLQPDEAQGTEPAASPNKSKKKKKKGKTANSDSFGEAEPLKEPEVATETTTDATSEPILKPAPDNTPETALEHGDQPEPEEPMRDTETSPVLDRRIDVMQDKTTEYSEDGEEPTVLPSETLTEPEPVPVESVPEHASAETAAEPEAQRATEPVPEPLPELLPEPQGANDLDASLPKKDLKKKKKKKSKGATIDLEEPVELVKDDVSKDGTPESFDAVESAIFEPVAEPEPTQEPTQVPTRGPELAPEMEKAAEVEPEAAPEAQPEQIPARDTPPAAETTAQSELDKAGQAATDPELTPETQLELTLTFDGHSEEKVVLDREVEPEKQEEDTLAPILSKNDKKKKNKKKKGKNIESPAEPSTDPEPVNEPADLSEIRKEHELPLESTELPQELVPEQADAARELDVLAEPTERVEPAMESGVDLEPVESGESVTVPLMVAEPSETRDLDISAEPAEVVESAEEPEVVGLPSETAELGVVPEPTERGQSSLGPVSTVKPNVGADTTNEVEAEPALAPIELLQDTTNPTEPFEPDKESAPAPETINTELVPEPEKAEEDDLSSAPTSKKAKKKKKKQKTKLIATAEESTDQTAQTDIPPAFLPINAEEAVTQLAPEGGGSGLLDAPPRLDQRQEIAKNLDESQDTALNPQDDAVITDAPAVDLDASSTAPISETLLDDSIKQPETIFDGAVPEDSAGKRSKKDQKKKNKKGVADTLPENEPSSLLAEDLTLPSSNTTDIPTTEPAPLIERASVENTQAISETPVEVKEELSHPSQEPEQPGGPILTVVDSSDAVARPSKEENLDTRELESRREQSQTVGRPEEEPMETISARQGDTTKAVGQGQLAVPNVLIRDETHGEDLQDDSPKAKASKKDKKKKKKAKLAQDTLEIAPESVPETSLSAVVKTGDTGSPAPDEAGPEKPADEEPIEAVPAEVKSTSIGPIEALTREAPQLDDFVEGTSAEHASLDTMQQHPATEAPVEDFSLKDSPLKPSTENAPVDIVATEGTPANDAPIEDSATLPGLDEATQEPESETSSKKSKKDKKKKAKKLARAMALSESSPAEETVAKEQTPQVETVVEEPAQLQNIGLTGELRDEPISGFLTELLQNEPAQDVSVLVDSFQTPRSIVEEPDQLREVSFTEALREEPTPVIATETPWDEATQKMSVETQPLQTIASSQEPTVVDKQDEEWTLPAKKKKSKKDQKHRLGDDSAMVVPDVEMKSPFPEVSSLLPEAPQQPIGGPPGPISAPSPEQFTSGGVRVLPLSQEVPRSPQKDDEEWALPLKRKSKKGKKTTDAAVSGVEEPLTLSPAETFSLKPTDTVEAETRSITEDAKPIEQPLAPIEQRVPDIPQYVASLDNAKSTALQNVPGSSREPAATNSGSMDVDIPTRDVQERAFPAPVQHDLTWPKEKSRGISLDKEPIATSFQEDRDQKPAAVHEPEVTGPELKSAPTSKLKRKKKQTKPTLDQARQPTSDVTPGPEAQGVKDVVVTVEPGLLSVENTKEISISDPKTPPRSRKSVIDPVAVTPEADRLKSPPKFKEETATASEVAAAVAAGAGGIAALAGRLGSKKKSKEKKELEDVTQADRDVKFEDEFWGGSGSRENNRKEKDATTGSEPKLSRKKVGSIKEDGFRSASPRPKESLRESKETKDSKDKTRDKSDKLETSRDTKEPTKTHDKTEPLSYSNRLKDMEESPVLGRGNMDLPRSAPQGLLRRESDGEVPMGSLLKEDSKAPTTFMELGSDLDFRRSPSRGLPPVQEIPEAESEPIKLLRKREDINRDSGFAEDSANPQQRGLPFKDEEQQRDSGVHTGDWDDGATPARQTAARERAALQTPEPGSERRLRRSPRGTPVLREPPRAAATPEPEKKKKQYGTLAAAAAAGVAVAAAAAQLRSATSTPSRSVSDNAPASRQSSPLPEAVSGRRSMSNTSLSRRRTPEALKLRPESPGIHRASGTPTPPLRRVNKRMSGDLRALRQQNNTTPVANEGRVRTKDMTDVYDGYGEGRIGSPRSPTRPHSMRRRQSMQVLELENKVEQLLAENRALNDARANAESSLTQRAATTLAERDAEIDSLRDSLKFLQNEVARLSEVNDGLASANAELANKDKARYIDLETRHATTARELDAARGAQDRFNQSLQEKDAEIVKLREQLEAAKEKIRDMQRQILESKAGDDHFLNLRDEDHFDHRCQQLCSHVQQWVLRFSKFSDMRACRLTSEINDEKTIDRLDNAVLDGSDVDTYLRDRVKRRDIFMSMTMNMVWEFVFTRYLFGMDREQRQKLKSLEKLLTEVGPPEAVRQWRAVTLTLLSKRDSFKRQRDLDTEAVVQAIFQTLCKILPPPSNLEDQIQSQLRRVMREAVGLSIEMRTQKAEYMMLPPLQPEYDADGELAATVQFNASMMNERSGSVSTTNEELEAQGAVVRVVLFPLVVKKGDDDGHGDEEIVVCPAQVLIARSKNHPFGAGSSVGARSHISVVTENMGQPEAEYMEGGI